MPSPISPAHFHLAALFCLGLALAFYMAASGPGLVAFGILGLVCEIGFWLSLLHARKARKPHSLGNRG